MKAFGTSSSEWKPPVLTVAGLPASGNVALDRRVVLDNGDGNIAGYVWTGAAWVQISDVNAAFSSHFGGYYRDTVTVAQLTLATGALPTTHRHLLVSAKTRGTNASGTVSLAVILSGDAVTTHYHTGRFFGGESSGNSPSNSFLMLQSSGATATADWFHESYLWIPNYQDSTTFTNALALNGNMSGAASRRIAMAAMTWLGSAGAPEAVTSLTLQHSSGNFDVGSRFDVYGIEEL